AVAWLYLLAVGLTVVATVVGIQDWVRRRPALTAEGRPVPWWARAMLLAFFAFVLVLGVMLLARTTPSQGGIFTERLTLFTLRAFGAFYTSLAIGTIPTLFARGLAPVLAFTWTGVALIVPILAAAVVNLDKFDFVARPDGLIYIGAYVIALVGAVILKGYGQLASPVPGRDVLPAEAVR
ncbi:MAG TPA: hypothetical protein VHN78_06895, partial [Chloroflexota bacterium]|nr:hypothetical protein [Chloroflexota bacterium]